MRKRFANSINNEIRNFQHKYYQKRIDEENFRGYVTYLKMIKIEKPLMVDTGTDTICILDNNYEWVRLYPDNENYVLTIMYNDKGNIVEWYFDVAKEIGVENGVPYQDDLYLDVVIMPDGEVKVIDEDELEDAFNKKEITIEEYKNNIERLTNLTDSIYNDITRELKNIEEGGREL